MAKEGQKAAPHMELCVPILTRGGFKLFRKGLISIITFSQVLTLSLLSFFCLVAGAPGRKRGHVALPAGLHPDWRRLQQGRGQRTARRRWLLRFSGGWKPKKSKNNQSC